MTDHERRNRTHEYLLPVPPDSHQILLKKVSVDNRISSVIFNSPKHDFLFLLPSHHALL
jgi:hypothetical protein